DRGRDGVWNVQRWLLPATSDNASDGASASAPGNAAPPWQLRIDDFALDGGVLHLNDGAVAGDNPLQADVDALKLRVQGLQVPAGDQQRPFKFSASARIGAPGAGATAGLVELSGQAGLAPLQAQTQARIERFPVALFAPYAADRMNLRVQRADAGFQGRLAFSLASDGLTLDLGGDALLADVRLATRPDANAARGEELMSWQRLALDGVALALKPGATPRAAIRSATLADFYSRLVITEQGRFNLRDVGAAPADAASAVPTAKAASSVATTTPTDLPFDLTIGQTKLVNGRVDFSDRFIKPNYSSRLTELNGQIGSFRSGSTEMAALEIHGRAAGTANLDIVGQINPTANPPAMDLRAKASDLELAPFSPYAGKYAGYAIERGKLSADLAYKITPDGKLEASNQITLNQLTFGDKVESPDATSLPVRFAVALLKDRNGVIDINLPVSGSLQDPRFSLGGLIWRVIVNLITKAVTSPFALFSGGGSGGEDLSTVEFAPATATLSDASLKALDKVAQALIERPSLTMTVTGAADPQGEAEAERRLFLERRVLTERRRELARAGAAADAPPPALSAQDRTRLVKEVYRQSTMPNKPRNALGFASDIPQPQMEALLRQNHLVSVESMRELALQRGVAVRDALVAKGLDSARLYLAAPKIRVAGEDDTAPWTPRVQLVLAHP
ncbi:MAG: DUF748 domain-containing protein, partial [Burkholderiales bacterium]|nr:DUF748 domain-containing protein [Burkholderiales bacterium]